MSLFSVEAVLAATENDEEDARLLRAIANGDRDAFHRLHGRHGRLLFSTALKVLNDPADAEEVLQETLFSLWRKARLFTPERGRPLTWMTSLARNRAIDRLRSKQRHARLRDALEVDGTRSIAAAPPPDGAEVSGRRDDCLAVRRAVVELTGCQRQAIEMAYFLGLTQQEIAERLGEPVGTVKARIRRGMRRLRAHFGAEPSGE